jgi:hypothetical protein
MKAPQRDLFFTFGAGFNGSPMAACKRQGWVGAMLCRLMATSIIVSVVTSACPRL